MKLDYVVYNNYDPKAAREITIRDYLLRNLGRIEEMFEFFYMENKDILKEFSSRITKSLSGMIQNRDLVQSHTEYMRLLNEYQFIAKEDALGLLAIQFMLEQLDLSTVEEGKAKPLFLNVERGDNIIPYTALSHLVEMVGRDQGIELWKEFVEFRAKNAPPPPPEFNSFKAMREGVNRMHESGGFAFTVHDFDENMYVGRFDKCVVYDSLKDMEDHELAYYVTCYTGMTIGNRQDWCVRMRRTQTLFSADYCDELYWNREVYDEPEQPPLEFTEKMTMD